MSTETVEIKRKITIKKKDNIEKSENTNISEDDKKEEFNDFKFYCNKVITFKLEKNKNIKEQFEYFRKMCELTSKYYNYRNISINNYMIIINKISDIYDENINNKDKQIIIDFYWDIMINFIAAVKSIYKNIIYKKDGPKYISEKSISFSSIIKKCCLTKNGNLKYKYQIKGFLNMTKGLVGWSIEDRRITGNWYRETLHNNTSNDESINDTADENDIIIDEEEHNNIDKDDKDNKDDKDDKDNKEEIKNEVDNDTEKKKSKKDEKKEVENESKEVEKKDEEKKDETKNNQIEIKRKRKTNTRK